MDFHEMFERFIDGYGLDPDWVSEKPVKEDQEQECEEEEEYTVPARKKSEGDWGP